MHVSTSSERCGTRGSADGVPTADASPTRVIPNGSHEKLT
jgi:hypothetical protein